MQQFNVISGSAVIESQYSVTYLFQYFAHLKIGLSATRGAMV